MWDKEYEFEDREEGILRLVPVLLQQMEARNVSNEGGSQCIR